MTQAAPRRWSPSISTGRRESSRSAICGTTRSRGRRDRSGATTTPIPCFRCTVVPLRRQLRHPRRGRHRRGFLKVDRELTRRGKRNGLDRNLRGPFRASRRRPEVPRAGLEHRPQLAHRDVPALDRCVVRTAEPEVGRCGRAAAQPLQGQQGRREDRRADIETHDGGPPQSLGQKGWTTWDGTGV